MNLCKSIRNYSIILLGSAILAFGLYNVHGQSSITEGGILGLTLLLKHWFNISPSLSGFVLDAICYIVAFSMLGKTFAKYSIVASCSFAAFYTLFELFPPILPSLVAAVLGGLLVGGGVGIIARCGGAAGGDDALAMSVSKFTGIRLSSAYLVADVCVLALSLTYIPAARIGYSLVTVMVSSFLIGAMQRKPKVTEKPIPAT